jgi:tyrosyl-DNA phosphodiesterase 2
MIMYIFLLQLSKFYAEESKGVGVYRKRWNIRQHPEPRNFVSALLDLKRSPNFYCHENTGASGIYRKIAWEHSVRVATCRLPGPTPEDAHCFDRLDGTSTFFKYAYEDDDCNVVLAGGMGWDEDLDGPGRFTYGERGVWVDAWCELRGSEDAGGWTYDVVANPMLKGRKPERKRPDRFFCKLRDFTLDSIEIIGVEAIPGFTYTDDKGGVVPVLPSHHFGLVLTISPKKKGS